MKHDQQNGEFSEDNPEDTVDLTNEEIRKHSRPLEEMRDEADRAQTDYILHKCQSSVQADLDGNLFRTVSADSMSPSAKLGDGPELPCFFRWDGNRLRLERIPWWVLDTMWGLERLPEEEVACRVWGRDDVSDGSMKTALSRVNTILDEAKYSRRLHRRNGFVFWE